MKRMSLLIGALLMAAPLFEHPLAQQRQSPSAKFTVTFDAGLILKNGSIRRLPRHDFYILDRALTQRDVETITASFSLESYTTDLTKKDNAPFPDFVCWDINAHPDITAFCKRFKAGLIGSVVTDFNSIGTFTVLPGTYYLVSHVDGGPSQAVWNLKIVVTGNQKIILDNRNAAKIADVRLVKP